MVGRLHLNGVDVPGGRAPLPPPGRGRRRPVPRPAQENRRPRRRSGRTGRQVRRRRLPAQGELNPQREAATYGWPPLIAIALRKRAFHGHRKGRPRLLVELISQLFHADVPITEQAEGIDVLEAEVARLREALGGTSTVAAWRGVSGLQGPGMLARLPCDRLIGYRGGRAAAHSMFAQWPQE